MYYSYLQRQRLQHCYLSLVVRYNFVSSLVAAPYVKTSALIRDQLQVWLHHYRVKILDTAVLLKSDKTNKVIISADINDFFYFIYYQVCIYVRKKRAIDTACNIMCISINAKEKKHITSEWPVAQHRYCRERESI